MAPARRATGFAGKATGQAQRAPVRRAVAGAGKACGIDEGLGQKDRVSMHRLHVPRQAPQAQPQHPRGQVRHRARRQDDKARVVGDQMQAPELLLRAPADPAVARGQLERARLPADEREPGRAHGRNVAQAFAEHAMKRQVVMPRHQPVPAPVFLRAPGRAHHDRAQINGAILCRQRSHGRHTATSKTKWPAPKSASAASPTPERTIKSPCPEVPGARLLGWLGFPLSVWTPSSCLQQQPPVDPAGASLSQSRVTVSRSVRASDRG